MLWLSGVCALGGDELERVQRELRARKLYFGPIDGQPSADTTIAVRR